MATLIQNTLYLFTPGLYIHRDHLSLRIEENKTLKQSLPIHNLESILIFGPISVSPPAMRLCWENKVAITFLSETGYFLARVEGFPQGSVLLRRNQHQHADNPQQALTIVQHLLAGKLQNSRWCLNRTSREAENAEEKSILKKTLNEIDHLLQLLKTTETIDSARGIEGRAAALYFSCFSLHLKKKNRTKFPFSQRLKHPAPDPLNIILSFLYTLLRHDCTAALSAIGLDPCVGFLHTERPGRESLSLDLMEEFRPFIDRLAITAINRGEIAPNDFNQSAGGIYELTEKGRKKLVQLYQKKKLEETRHELLQEKCRIGQLWFIQARILARLLRGDIPNYLPHLFH